MNLWKSAAIVVEKLWAKIESRRKSRALCRDAESPSRSPHTIA
jgi:hypothetical protein